MNAKHWEDLKARAETLVKKRKMKTVVDPDIYQLIEELNLYHAELEIQNEDLVKSQIELQNSHDRFADLYHLAPVGYFTFNKEGLIIDVNQAGVDLLGLKKQTLINRCFTRYIAPEHQTLFSQFRQYVLKVNSSHSCEIKLLRWSGPVFDALLECKAIQTTDSADKQILVCITDVTHQHVKDEGLHHQQIKMASIDRMRSMNEQLYSISQKQNHALTVIDNYIYGCIRRLEAENFNKEDLLITLKKVAQQSRNLADVILQMKKFVSKTIFRYEVTDINMLINETLSLINYEILDLPITIHYEPIENFPLVKVDKLHIKQVLLNLARNSIEAMRDGNINQPKLLLELRLTHDKIIELTILDNGPGFQKDISHQIFEPHFTTKPYAAGMGLSVSRTIVEKHGGKLTGQNNTAGGAQFQVVLPCTAIAS